MIYVSSSCVRAKTVREVAQKLFAEGYTNIEWSGGTQYETEVERKLRDLQQEYGMHFLLHNYFPAPEVPFVLNLASLDETIGKLSADHLANAIRLSAALGAKKFAFHAGFLIHIPLSEMGKSISRQDLFPRAQAWIAFRERYLPLKDLAEQLQVDLYLENNVLSSTNLFNFQGVNPFFLTCLAEMQEHIRDLSCRVLLDTGHLKVSAQSLRLCFPDELKGFLSETDYVHLSDNDGHSDLNEALFVESELYRELSVSGLSGKTLTLEVYSGMDDLKRSLHAAESLLR